MASPSGAIACKYTRTAHLYGVAKESERDIWMQRLLEAMCDVLPPAATCRFYRAGWCYMKPSITGQWSGAWVLLQKHKKRLVVYSMASMNVEWLDLRKARCLILKEPEPEELRALHVERAGPMLMLDCPPHALYMVMGTARETKVCMDWACKLEWAIMLYIFCRRSGATSSWRWRTTMDPLSRNSS